MTFSNPTESGKPVIIRDEGVLITGSVGSIDFVGAGVAATAVGNDVTATITGTSTALTEVNGETPSGTINGINDTFTLAHSPVSSFKLFLNGARLKNTVDYTISGTTIIFAADVIPQTGSNLLADYLY